MPNGQRKADSNFPSCTFVSFVVGALDFRDYQRVRPAKARHCKLKARYRSAP